MSLLNWKVCDSFKKQKWNENWDDFAKAPYAYNNENEWISYENEQSLRDKVNTTEINLI